ncbi:MAG: biopolymer transporter ExbD [Bdellovibrionota bacterium]
MRYRRKKALTEFELDLAPLLAVMVKLVPVLLLTTSFVSFAALDTQLPSNGDPAISDPKTNVTMALKSTTTGYVLTVEKSGTVLETVNAATVADVKKYVPALAVKYPDIKTFFLSPSDANSFEEMAKLLEASPVPEVVLANVFAGDHK